MIDRIHRLKELLKQSPHDAFVRFALAKEYEKRGNTTEAVQRLRDLLKDKPEYVGAYYHLAELLKVEEKVKEALEIYDLGIKMAREHRDDHALSELRNARMNLEMEMEGNE